MSKTVEAAGAIVYRRRTDFPGWMKFSDDGRPPAGACNRSLLEDLELCLVHRPKYDDWSWPKGKLEARESSAQAAVREVGEETGLLIRLGPYLGDAEYPLGDEGGGKNPGAEGLKHIRYWMGVPLEDRSGIPSIQDLLGPIRRPDPKEVDQTRWASAWEARNLLTHPSDRDILDAFIDRVDEGGALARQLIIVRHGKAVARKEWKGKDSDRPLTPKGAGASYSLARELACFAPDLVLSSPWKRCVQTLRPYADETGQEIATVDCLTESAYRKHPQAALTWLDHQMGNLMEGEITAVVCMHRPVLEGIFDRLRGLCLSRDLAKRLSPHSPYMPTGTAVVISLACTDGSDGQPSIIDIQKVTPLVY